ncbi:helix-turn-helix transcriptional regulator [Xanthomonas sp. AmX2]|nr:helix-turn-helix transcriptional regulator [Xanthomonas sp.]
MIGPIPPREAPRLDSMPAYALPDAHPCLPCDPPPRGQVLAANCPSRAVLSHVTSRWGVLALVVLRTGTYRFGDLRRRLQGVSEKMLAQTLQALEADGFVRRTSYPVVPPHVEYGLTALGQDVAAHVHELVDWIETHIGTILGAHAEVPKALPD